MKSRSKILEATAVIIGAAALIPTFAFAAPYLLLSSYSGSPGSTVSVSGAGFGPSTNVLVSMDGQSQTASAAITNGSFSGARLTVPQSAPGPHTVLATSPQREQAQTSYYITGFYPKAAPSSYYVLPGQAMSFSGSNFAPNQQVTIQGGGGTLSATSDSNGNFTTQTFTVPFKWQNSDQTFTVNSSGTAYQIPLTVKVGSFYPNLNPSSYYVARGSGMSASVTGFAPGETVYLLVNGALVAQTAASGSGNASFNFNAPGSGTSATLMAQGASSGVQTSRTITLY